MLRTCFYEKRYGSVLVAVFGLMIFLSSDVVAITASGPVKYVGVLPKEILTEQWLLAQANALSGVASTAELPIHVDGPISVLNPVLVFSTHQLYPSMEKIWSIGLNQGRAPKFFDLGNLTIWSERTKSVPAVLAGFVWTYAKDGTLGVHPDLWSQYKKFWTSLGEEERKGGFTLRIETESGKFAFLEFDNAQLLQSFWNGNQKADVGPDSFGSRVSRACRILFPAFSPRPKPEPATTPYQIHLEGQWNAVIPVR